MHDKISKNQVWSVCDILGALTGESGALLLPTQNKNSQNKFDRLFVLMLDSISIKE